MPSSQLLRPDQAQAEVQTPGGAAKPRLGAVLLIALGLVVAALLAAVHVTQGSANVGLPELLGLLVGGSDDQAAAVLVASRMPRLAAGVLVGVALGVAGLVMQSVSRNVLASPDTLAVNAGSYFAVVAVAAFGIVLPIAGGGAVAFLGGLAAAALVLGLSAGGGRGGGTVRLVFAGSAIALALTALTTMLLLLHPERTEGLYAWGNGTLAQTGMEPMLQFGPVVLVAVAALFLFARQFDIVALGDDTATVLGVRVRRTRMIGIVIAVLLSATAVTVAGPIGFVGLAAPAIVRLIAARVPGMQRHVLLIPAAPGLGAGILRHRHRVRHGSGPLAARPPARARGIRRAARRARLRIAAPRRREAPRRRRAQLGHRTGGAARRVCDEHACASRRRGHPR